MTEIDEYTYLYEGQLDVFECIEIAETGSDGHPTTEQLNGDEDDGGDDE